MTCIIVDDEPLARQGMEMNIATVSSLTLLGSFSNALAANDFIRKERVDLMFLDINMPVMDGISFVKTMRNPPQIIFTTAYKEYALDAFDLAACDYLLKPFSFDRFMIAVDKALERLPGRQSLVVKEPAENFIFIKTDGKIYKIYHDDLLYAEAQGNYTRIVTATNILLPKMPFSSLEELLPGTLFLRTHRSFIINKSKIGHIEGNRVFINNTEIPIGTNYREMLLKDLGFSK